MVKAIARALFRAEIGARRAIDRRRGRESWILGGDCGGCAKCCEAPSIQVDKITWYLPSARRLFLWWQRVVNGFELTGTEPKRTFVFKCSHFDPVTRRCDSYDTRPGICRDYPRFLLSEAWPEFFPGCGYRAIARNGKGLASALEKTALSDEEKAELRRKLRLE